MQFIIIDVQGIDITIGDARFSAVTIDTDDIIFPAGDQGVGAVEIFVVAIPDAQMFWLDGEIGTTYYQI